MSHAQQSADSHPIAPQRLPREDRQDLEHDAESGQRGFLLTGKSDYLRPYEQAHDVLGADLDRLLAMFPPERARPADISELRAVLDRKLMELQSTIDLKRAGKEPSREALIHGIESIHEEDLGLGQQLRLNYSAKSHKGFDHVIPTVVRGGRAVPFTDWSTVAVK